MAFAFQVTTSDPSNLAGSALPVLRYDLEQALSSWSQYLNGQGVLVVNLVIGSTPQGRASGGATAYISTGATTSGGARVVEASSDFLMRTGTHVAGTTSDITITLDQSYLDNFDLSPNLSPTSSVASGKYNPISTFLHEVGHGMGMAGYYAQNGAISGNFRTEFDTFIQYSGSAATFQGSNAAFAYGAAVPITTASTQENFYHFGNTVSDGSRSAATVQDPLTLDLMNGVVFFFNYAYQISALDVATLQDLGFSLTPAGQALAHTVTNRTASATIVGTGTDDTINALGGNASVTGRGGNDVITGGTGTNSSLYTGLSKNFTVSLPAGSQVLTVRDKVGSEGRDTLTDIQRLQFADGTAETSWFAKTASLSSQQAGSLTEIYIASFNRAPDALGLDYWGSRLKDGMSLQDIARSFFVQSEAAAFYPSGQTTQAFVTSVYNNVLNRGPDSEGLTYWTGELQSQHVSQDAFLLAIVNGAKAFPGSTDSQVLANKQSAGGHFALTQGLGNTTQARAVMALVDATAASVTAANALTDSYARLADTSATSELVIQIVGLVP